jgi:hypothetical protein
MNLTFQNLTNEDNILFLKNKFYNPITQKSIISEFYHHFFGRSEEIMALFAIFFFPAGIIGFISSNINIFYFSLFFLFSFFGSSTCYYNKNKSKIKLNHSFLFFHKIAYSHKKINKLNANISDLSNENKFILEFILEKNIIELDNKEITLLLFKEHLKNCNINELLENKKFVLDFINSLDETEKNQSLKLIESRLLEKSKNEEKIIHISSLFDKKQKIIKNI